MIKVATIVPQRYLSLVKEDTYHMALAHLINKPGMEEYTKFFKSAGADENSYVIMDNGLIEGDPRPIEELLAKANAINADELILPDVFRDSKATLRAVDSAATYLQNHTADMGSLGFMAVPQGNTLEAWLSCATLLMDYPMITCLGIPKVLVDIAGRDGRYIAIQKLAERLEDIDARQPEIHLLGCWRTPLELSIIAKGVLQKHLPTIRGVDSALAYVAARAGIKLTDGDRPDNEPIDFMDGAIEKENLLKYNIMLWNDSVDMDPNKSVIWL